MRRDSTAQEAATEYKWDLNYGEIAMNMAGRMHNPLSLPQ
jgi:hypothetical protein